MLKAPNSHSCFRGFHFPVRLRLSFDRLRHRRAEYNLPSIKLGSMILQTSAKTKICQALEVKFLGEYIMTYMQTAPFVASRCIDRIRPLPR
jgi:hypothetical protein